MLRAIAPVANGTALKRTHWGLYADAAVEQCGHVQRRHPHLDAQRAARGPRFRTASHTIVVRRMATRMKPGMRACYFPSHKSARSHRTGFKIQWLI